MFRNVSITKTKFDATISLEYFLVFEYFVGLDLTFRHVLTYLVCTDVHFELIALIAFFYLLFEEYLL